MARAPADQEFYHPAKSFSDAGKALKDAVEKIKHGNTTALMDGRFEDAVKFLENGYCMESGYYARHEQFDELLRGLYNGWWELEGALKNKYPNYAERIGICFRQVNDYLDRCEHNNWHDREYITAAEKAIAKGCMHEEAAKLLEEFWRIRDMLVYRAPVRTLSTTQPDDMGEKEPQPKTKYKSKYTGETVFNPTGEKYIRVLEDGRTLKTKNGTEYKLPPAAMLYIDQLLNAFHNGDGYAYINDRSWQAKLGKGDGTKLLPSKRDARQDLWIEYEPKGLTGKTVKGHARLHVR